MRQKSNVAYEFMATSHMRVVVTGGTGKAGRWVVEALRNEGYDTLNVDWAHDGSDHGLCAMADLTDAGQAHELVSGANVVVHLAAIPAPDLRSDAETFRINTMSTYNVFAAAVAAGASKVVWASSETVLGLPFDIPPEFAPIDETAEPRPETSYALSKIVGEHMARQFARRSGVPFIGLRFSNIMEPTEYQSFPTFWDDPHLRKWNLWGYVDVRDVAKSVLLAIEADVSGAEVCITAAGDTVMSRPSSELMAEIYPDVPMRRVVEGRETLLAIDRARSILGYEPAHSWKDQLG